MDARPNADVQDRRNGVRVSGARDGLSRAAGATEGAAPLGLEGASGSVIRYEGRGPAVSVEAKKVRTRKMIRELRTLGYRVELLEAPSNNPA